MEIIIQKIYELHIEDLNELLNDSKQEGYRFIQRLIDDYKSEKNRFDKQGEALYLCYIKSKIVGVCGLNRESDQNGGQIGRLRRFYILPDFRRMGIGRKLIQKILMDAVENYDVVQLKTDTETADRFYRSVGFIRSIEIGNSTHYYELKNITKEH